MCGITAIISKTNQNILSIILNSLQQLQNRGYDSAGLSFFEDNKIITYKKASTQNTDSLEYLKTCIEPFLLNNKINACIGHTRWATHGGKTDTNSHPHTSNKGLVTLVHNGIIENFVHIKNILSEYTFYTETDTEVIANLIEYNLLKYNNIEKSIEESLKCLEGTYGLAILFKEECDAIYIARNGSPIIIAENENYVMVTSERSGFLDLFNQYISLPCNEVMKISKNGTNTHELPKIPIQDIDMDLTPAPFKHWTLKEIYEQSLSLQRAINYGGRIQNNRVILGGLTLLIPYLSDIKNIILLGCGTSYNASVIGYYYLREIKQLNIVRYIDGSEFNKYDIPHIGKTLVIFCSQSGETKDLHRAIDIAKSNNCITMGIVNVVDSIIAREVDCGIYLNAGREVAVASTKSFTSMIVVLSLFHIWLCQKLILNPIFHSQYKNVMELSNDVKKTLNICENISSIIILKLNTPSIFILGKGIMEAVALETALKIKELCYIHAEGYNGSSLKHGPFALLKKNFPVILLIDSKNRDKMYNAYEEIKARGAYILIITELTDLQINNESTHMIIVPKNYYQVVIFSVVLQFISYKLSLYNNNNPDKPKNLAKVVTVE
jgi:glucosamine--fructose-6-phosphate aminotransferase (isomerizing)